jgi:hypothetical protein
MWKETVMAYFKIKVQHFLGFLRTTKKNLLGWWTFWPIFELRTSQVRSRNPNLSFSMLYVTNIEMNRTKYKFY